jgi:hypothetical protein
MMAVEVITHWRIETEIVPDVEIYTDRYGIVIEQGGARVTFHKAVMAYVMAAMQAAADSLPDGHRDIPF